MTPMIQNIQIVYAKPPADGALPDPACTFKERTSTSPKGNIALIPRQLYHGGIHQHHRCVGSVRQKSDYVALQAVASRSAVFRSSATIALTRDCARRDRGAATAIAKGTSPARLATATATPLTSGSLSPKFVAQLRRRTCLSSASRSVRVRMLRAVKVSRASPG